jgi:hypothetical protein
MSPTDLAVGRHDLTVEISDSSGAVYQDGIAFFIDAAGTGSCS